MAVARYVSTENRMIAFPMIRVVGRFDSEDERQETLLSMQAELDDDADDGKLKD